MKPPPWQVYLWNDPYGRWHEPLSLASLATADGLEGLAAMIFQVVHTHVHRPKGIICTFFDNVNTIIHVIDAVPSGLVLGREVTGRHHLRIVLTQEHHRIIPQFVQIPHMCLRIPIIIFILIHLVDIEAHCELVIHGLDDVDGASSASSLYVLTIPGDPAAVISDDLDALKRITPIYPKDFPLRSPHQVRLVNPCTLHRPVVVDKYCRENGDVDFLILVRISCTGPGETNHIEADQRCVTRCVKVSIEICYLLVQVIWLQVNPGTLSTPEEGQGGMVQESESLVVVRRLAWVSRQHHFLYCILVVIEVIVFYSIILFLRRGNNHLGKMNGYPTEGIEQQQFKALFSEDQPSQG
ncbi:hypothetical protein SAY86_016455 [Trapa natans]|uniref:Uncharacterized protein n=1 Tax=Trapa natans TaxID=22666 RepID=A0AAN7L6X0_TRANT|nr:hypothetical protein SAY86_016455 [Trapa natans]